MSITATGYPSETVFTFATPDSYDSSELVKYLVVDATDFDGDEYIEIEYNGALITVYIESECRYTPVEIHFINKEGAQQVITFFKARKDDLKIDSETFESDKGQPNLGNHQFVDYNVNGRTKFSVNSGFIDESMNDTFKQLLLSESAWSYESSAFVPVNIKSSSLKYQTRQNDRLINYEIDFDYSYKEVNNV